MSGRSPRLATTADLDAAATLDAAAFPSGAWGRASLASELERDGGQFFVLDGEAGGLVGLAIGWANAGTSEVLHIAVDPAARRRGLARRLLAELLSAAAIAGAEESWLEVAHDNAAAIALYLGEGYQEVYRRPDYYGPGAHALLLKRAL